MNNGTADRQEFLAECLKDMDNSIQDFSSRDEWSVFVQQGSKLWLNETAGSRIRDSWTGEFSGIQGSLQSIDDLLRKGTYDEFLHRLNDHFERSGGSGEKMVREAVEYLVALHGKQFGDQFQSTISMPLAMEFDTTVEEIVGYSRQIYEFEPDRFLISIPFSAEGIIAGRRLLNEEIPIHFTGSFSVRQNYVIALLAGVRYGQVGIGAINRLFAGNTLPEIKRIGEKLALASSKTLRFLREKHDCSTVLIASDIQSGDQLMNLGEVDVLCFTSSVASEYLELVEDKRTTGRLQLYDLLNEAEEEPGGILTGLSTVQDSLRSAVETIRKTEPGNWSVNMLMDIFHEHGAADLFPEWGPKRTERIRRGRETPDLNRWKEELREGVISLDSLLSAYERMRVEEQTLEVEDYIQNTMEKLW